MALLGSLKTSINNYLDTVTRHQRRTESPKEPPFQIFVDSKPSLPPAVVSYYEAQERNRPQDERWKRIERNVAVCGVVLLAVYTIFTIGMYCVNKESADAAKSAAETAKVSLDAVERAFVVFEGTQVIQFSERDKAGVEQREMIFFSQMENAGTTPAKGITQAFTGDNLPAEPTEDQFINIAFGRAYFIGPKVRYIFGRVKKPESFVISTPIDQLPSAPTQVITQGGTFFWGWVTYRDAFPGTREHVTEFCQKISVISGRQDPNTGVDITRTAGFNLTFDHCQSHNCSDEDCEDYNRVSALLPPR
jgi:hypothetical protein